MTIIEREQALASLTGLLDDAVAGHGRVAVVAGPVAVGKTALLDAFADRAVAAGAVLLAASGSPQESGLTWGIVEQLLADVPDGAADADGSARVRELMASDGPKASPEHVAEVADVLCRTLLGASQIHPLVLVVDDVHHADPPSLFCLSHLARRMRGARVAAVFGHTDQSPYQHSDFRLEVLRLPKSLSVTVEALSADGVALMAADLLGADAAGLCHEITGGSPLLVRALLDGHRAAVEAAGRAAPASVSGAAPVSASAPGDGLAVGAAFGRGVVACLRRFDSRVVRVVQALAVLGRADGLDRLLGVDRMTVDRALAGPTAAGLLAGGGEGEGDSGPARFRHPAARSAVLLDTDPGIRMDLHRRAAELGHRDGAPASEIAEHLLAAGEAAHPWAVTILEETALHALARGRVVEAVECLRLACRGSAEEHQLTRVRTRLMRLEWRTDPSAPIRHLAGLSEAMRRGHLSGSDALVLARALLWHGRAAEAREVLAWLAGAETMSDPATVAELHSTLPWLRCSHPPFADAAPSADGLDRAPVSAPSMASSWREEAALALEAVLTRGPSERIAIEAERILRDARLNEMGLDTVESALLALTYGDYANRAAPWCDRLIEEAAERGVPCRQARLAAIRAEISLRQGDLPAVERHARQALDTMPAGGWGVVAGGPLSALLIALTAMGRQDEAKLTLDLPVSEAMSQSRYGLHYLHARGRFHLWLGHLDRALRDFRACGELMIRWGLDAPGLIAWRTEAAEALLAMDEHDEARKVLQEHLGRVGKAPSRASGVAMRLLAATHEPPQRPAILRRAADVLQACGDRYEFARALTDLTEAFQVLGEPRRARLIGGQAQDLARACQAEPLARRLAEKLGQAPVDTAAVREGSPADLLSEAERRVAALATRGFSNVEISKRLYVSVSTVEQHLTQTYRKLELGGRGELPSVLGSSV